MQKKNSKLLLALLLAFSASACGTVHISDQEWCGDMGELGASCFHTLSTDTRDIDKEHWDQERYGQICGSAAAYVEFKNAVLKLCRDTGRCDYQTQQAVREFGYKVYRQTLKSAEAVR